MIAEDEREAEFLRLYLSAQPVEQEVVKAFMRACLDRDSVKLQPALDRSKALIARFRAGEEIRLSDLESIGNP